MTASTCTCRAYVGERHWRDCALFPAVRQPVAKMKGHPSLYKRPMLSDAEKARFLHRLDHIDGCADFACETCYGSPFVSEDGHRE